MPDPDPVGSEDDRWQAVERELSEAAAQVRERDAALEIARRADLQVATIETELSEALERARLEQQDVDDLKRITAKSILAILKRSRGTELEREQAQLEADRGLASEAADRRDHLLRAQAEARARTRSYRGVDQRLAGAFAAKEQVLRDLGGPGGQRLGQIAVERGELAAQVKELRKAAAAGRQALQGCDALLGELGSANNWSNVDLWLGGGLITSAIKHDHMDSAVDLSRSVDRSFAAFRRELGDVHMESATGAANLSTGIRFVDTWLDNIFTDFSVHERIGESRHNAEHVRAAVATALQACEARLSDAAARQADLEHERDDVLRSTTSPTQAPSAL